MTEQPVTQGIQSTTIEEENFQEAPVLLDGPGFASQDCAFLKDSTGVWLDIVIRTLWLRTVILKQMVLKGGEQFRAALALQA